MMAFLTLTSAWKIYDLKNISSFLLDRRKISQLGPCKWGSWSSTKVTHIVMNNSLGDLVFRYKARSSQTSTTASSRLILNNPDLDKLVEYLLTTYLRPIRPYPSSYALLERISHVHSPPLCWAYLKIWGMSINISQWGFPRWGGLKVAHDLKSASASTL